jgi:aspartyl-tRNA(Asn)/glutamyl-tRNA(Gln) amidotransferase subunit C
MSAGIDRREVQRIAALAHLELTEDEQVLYARQLQEILAYAQQVGDIDTRDVPPTSHVLTAAPAERPDEVRPSLPVGDVLGNAPDPGRPANLFKVPKVIG